jgi:hypothetical protein
MRGDIPRLHNISSLHRAKLSRGCIFMVWDLVKHRDNFMFTLPIVLLASPHALRHLNVIRGE